MAGYGRKASTRRKADWTFPAAILVLALLAAGCGGGDERAPATPPVDPPVGPPVDPPRSPVPSAAR